VTTCGTEYTEPSPLERFLLYKGYESGFNNDLMSLELAVGLAWITRRRLVYYGTTGGEK